MEPFEAPMTKMRLVLALGKFRVIRVIPGTLGATFVIELGRGVTLSVDSPVPADVRLGDLLTLYTEVLADAQPSQPPVQ